MDQEAVSTALRVAESVKGEFPNTRPTDLSMRQTSFMGQPEATSARVTMGEGVEGRGSRVEALPGAPPAGGVEGQAPSVAGQQLPAPSPLPIQNAPTGAFTMDRNNAAPANVPEGVIAMPGRPALPAGGVEGLGSRVEGQQIQQPPAAGTSAEAFLDDVTPSAPTGEAPITGYTDPATTGGVPLPYTEAKLKISDIKLSDDVPNFKENADPNTGVVRGQQIEGNIDMRAFGHLMVWQRNNGAQELISGRHRFDAAKRNGLDSVPVYIMREADGFTKPMAMSLDAELNILDEKGEVKDYANYFRNTSIAEDQAAQRGLLSRAKGRAGFRIGTGAGPDLYAAYQAGAINEARTLAIATAAPNDIDLQRAGYAAAQRKMAPEVITGYLGYIKASKDLAAQGSQGDLFGTSDAALQRGEQIAKAAAARVREINDQVAAVQSAAKRPEAAAKLGVNVADPEGILKRVGELQALATRYKSFYTDPEIMAELSGVSPEQAAAEMTPPSPPNIATNGEGNLFGESAMPFNLSGQVEAGPTPAEIAAAEAERLAQEEADRNQGDMFSGGFSGTADYGPQGNGGGGSGGTSAAEAGPSMPDNASMVSRGPGWEMPEILGATDRVLPIEVPELIRWFREATGFSPSLRRGARSLGMFTGIGKGRIWIRTDLFSNPASVAMTLAHEIGHWLDYLPDESLKRGNILGRLGSLLSYLKQTMPLGASPSPLDSPSGPAPTAKERRKIADAALEDLRKSLGEVIVKVMVEEPIFRELGISTDDVKSLFGLNAREELPALYDWFAKQDSATKKSVVKKAMAGIVDERIKQFGKQEQIGTRMVEKEVITAGRAPTAEEIKQAIVQAMRDRALHQQPIRASYGRHDEGSTSIGFGKMMGLPNDFAVKLIAQVGKAASNPVRLEIQRMLA
jgi:hypothetical protein